MPQPPVSPELLRMMELLAKLPGLGPRSAQRAALFLLSNRETTMQPLVAALDAARQAAVDCGECGALDTSDPCPICADPRRDMALLCVVERVADVWALEKCGVYAGRYHVLGGALSPLDGTGPEALNIAALRRRAAALPEGAEIILALGATLDGQTTAHYLHDMLRATGHRVTRLAHGVPMGGELDHLDQGTIHAALDARRDMGPAADAPES